MERLARRQPVAGMVTSPTTGRSSTFSELRVFRGPDRAAHLHRGDPRDRTVSGQRGVNGVSTAMVGPACWSRSDQHASGEPVATHRTRGVRLSRCCGGCGTFRYGGRDRPGWAGVNGVSTGAGARPVNLGRPSGGVEALSAPVSTWCVATKLARSRARGCPASSADRSACRCPCAVVNAVYTSLRRQHRDGTRERAQLEGRDCDVKRGGVGGCDLPLMRQR